MSRTFFFIPFLFFLSPSFGQKIIEKDFSKFFDVHGVDGCFILYDERGDRIIRYNPDLCETGYIPASTFKIPHSLIALEEGIVRDTAQVFPWDGVERPVKAWNRDQTLITAIKYSCVWVYSGFTEQISLDKYYDYMRAFNYGNQNLAGPPDRFWLAGNLRISASGQIDFLHRFYHYDLPVSRSHIDLVKNLIILEQNSSPNTRRSWRLSGKTGGAFLPEGGYIMWLTGYLETDESPYFYALNFTSDDFNGTRDARYEITKSILDELGLME